ncbi:winged helix-turn-helix domain-containing protein (plasmid) [Phaeobacter inhibens]|uniref:winged helix-turn-helix domain-containing protein n=1 Tax=Phaeobacter inhibens TaxID=221822 RepID=UPI0021A9157F|nr:winged helix-turn-helix domain-containing protein [Phaeobacter inhibens]UWS06006.1 winged helix-turn-helix domain-containing protein [Phaeobacter inhibens]
MTDTVKHPDGGNQLQIGEHFYDPVSNELLDPSGNTVRLRPQSGQVLAVLARQSGTVITKSELFAAVWPNTSVTDDSLTQCISEIRKSLGDSDRKLLRTIPKQGYLLDSRSVVLSSTTQKTLPHHISADLIEWEATRQRTVMIICRPAGGPDETSLYDAVQSVVRLHRPAGAKAIDGNSATLTFATPIEALRCSRALNRSAGALGIGVLRTAFDTLERSRIAALSKLLRVSNDGREYATVEVRDQLHFSWNANSRISEISINWLRSMVSACIVCTDMDRHTILLRAPIWTMYCQQWLSYRLLHVIAALMILFWPMSWLMTSYRHYPNQLTST